MIINNCCLNKNIKEKVNEALNDFCKNIDEYDYCDFYKYVIKKYQLYVFYDPYSDEYFISDDWNLLV